MLRAVSLGALNQRSRQGFQGLGETSLLLRCLGGMTAKVHDEPSTVASEDGQVTVDGPDGVAVTLTPEAAEETGHRLIANACDAAGRNRMKNRTGKPASEERISGQA